jgi:hypothetical protein
VVVLSFGHTPNRERNGLTTCRNNSNYGSIGIDFFIFVGYSNWHYDMAEHQVWQEMA